MSDIAAVSVPLSATVRGAIETIAAGGQQLALVLDDAGRLLGVVSDGDVRRGILRGVDLTAPVAEIMNASPLVAHDGDDSDDLTDRMEKLGVRRVPVIDDVGRVIDLFSVERLLHPASTTTPVVLMAGGKGQRLYPLTKDVPKPMLPVGDAPLLEIILRNLAAQGFRNVYLSVNYLAEVIEDHVGDGSQYGLRVEYVHEDKPLGTAGALGALRDTITESFLVMNSDLLTRVNLRNLLSFHRKRGAQATIGVREYVFEIPYGVVNLDGPWVASLAEKPLHRSLVNAGIYALEPDVLSRLEPGEYLDMPSLLELVMSTGEQVGAFPIHESWLDVGRPEDLERARLQSAHWTRP